MTEPEAVALHLAQAIDEQDPRAAMQIADLMLGQDAEVVYRDDETFASAAVKWTPPGSNRTVSVSVDLKPGNVELAIVSVVMVALKEAGAGRGV